MRNAGLHCNRLEETIERSIWLFVALASLMLSIPIAGQERPITIRAGIILDGRGGVIRNASIVVQGSKIVKIDPNAVNPTYDLRSLTILPGLIDTHVHITG